MNLIESVSRMFHGLSNDTVIGKVAITAGALTAAYFTPIVGLLITCFVCTLADMFYGIKRAKKFGLKITSKENWKGTLVKIRDEFALVLLAHLIEYTVMGDKIAFVLSGGVTVIIALTELWSVIENLNTIDPTGPWRMLGKFLKKKGENYIGIDLEDNDNNTTSEDIV